MEFEDDGRCVTSYVGGASKPFFIPPHWHELHDEHWEVLEGKIELYTDGVWTVYEAEPGKDIHIPRGVVHSARSLEGQAFRFREYAVAFAPLPGGKKFKQIFFRDIFWGYDPPPPALHVFRTFLEGDTYVKVPGPKILGKALTWAIGSIAKCLGDARPEELTAAADEAEHE